MFVKYNPSLLFVLVICFILLPINDGTIIAKSKITMCLQDSKNDPVNIVANKKCEKKLVVTKAITTEEKGSDLLYVNISKVDDEVEHEEARLYYPFVVTFSQTPMRLIYPYYPVTEANNKPYETTKRHYWCQDGYLSADEDFSCPIRVVDGRRIWDSQGFCCRCTKYEDRTSGGEHRYHRGNTECGNAFNIPIIMLFFKNHDRQSSHCMMLDDLRYTMHGIEPYRLFFKIFIKAYDIIEEENDGHVHRKMVDGGTITLSNLKKSGRGKYDRLYATLVGTFEANKQFTSLTEKFLAIPNRKWSKKVDFKKHPQTKFGARDYMLFPKSYVAYKDHASSCDKIGVSYTAFRLQGGQDGQGEGCIRKVGSCLNNQIKDFFEEDMERRRQQKRPLYFVERYGDLVGIQSGTGSYKYALMYKVKQVITSAVTLEISADDIILIYNKATGIIVKAFSNEFRSLSRDGRINVIVQNTGLVSAEFAVTMKVCSVGILRGLQQKATINPQATHIFTLPLKTTVHVADVFTCTVSLWDARGNYLDSANVTFKTTKSCVCLQSCKCACSGTADSETCVLEGLTQEDDGVKMYDNVKLDRERMTTLEKFFWNLNVNLANISALLVQPTVSRVFNAWVFLCLLFGLFKAHLGARKGGAPIAYFGWWWELPTGQETFINSKGQKIAGTYNSDGDLTDPRTGEILKSEKTLLYFGNLLFFFLIIFIVGVRAARFYQKFEKVEEVKVSLSGVVLAATTTYRNLKKFPNADKVLKNPGSKFSIAGKLEQTANTFTFKVVNEIQVIEVDNNGDMLLLTPPLSFDGKMFNKQFTKEEAMKEITLEPTYVCINEEPMFDYYEDDEQDVIKSGHSNMNSGQYYNITIDDDNGSCSSEDHYDQVPPTPPTPDYSNHNLITEDTYEVPAMQRFSN